MTVYNTDGSTYKLTGDLRQYDPTAPEHDLLNFWDEEAIKICGTPLFYYEVFIQEQTIDPIYVEDRGKLFSNHPIVLDGYYEPQPSQNELGISGLDSPDEITFELNYKAVLKKIGHPPVIGSRIFSPHLSENWVIVQRNLGEFKKWGAIRLELFCKRFREDRITGEGEVTQKKPDIGIDDILNH